MHGIGGIRRFSLGLSYHTKSLMFCFCKKDVVNPKYLASIKKDVIFSLSFEFYCKVFNKSIIHTKISKNVIFVSVQNMVTVEYLIKIELLPIADLQYVCILTF